MKLYKIQSRLKATLSHYFARLAFWLHYDAAKCEARRQIGVNEFKQTRRYYMHQARREYSKAARAMPNNL